MAAKRVILHMGFHKTASSALQAVLTQQADRLAQAGIAYPFREPDNIVAAGGCSGNIIQILFQDGHIEARAHGAAPGKVDPSFFPRLRQIVDSQPQDTVLLSGEFLSTLKPDRMALLHDALRGHETEVVAFVRDPFDFVHSGWRQIVKMAVRKPGFDDYIRDKAATMSMNQGFRAIMATFGPPRLLRYERHQRNVSAAFFTALGLDHHFPDGIPAPGRTHNASVSHSEAQLAIAIDAEFGNPDLTSTVIRSLVTRPDRREVPYYNRAQHAKILEIFRDVIPAINALLPAEDALSDQLRDIPDMPDAILPQDMRAALALLHRHMGRRPRAAAAAPGLPLRRLFRRAAPPVLPGDFDAEAYLLHNPDVAAAKVDPAEHFLRHGLAEGRRYKFS